MKFRDGAAGERRAVRRFSVRMNVALTISLFCAISFFDVQDSIGPNLNVPPEIVKRVETSIIDQVGKTFFEEHLRYERGGRTSGGFVTCWRVEARYDQTIECGFCLTVNHLGEPRKIPLPDCRTAPEQCGVFIGRSVALDIAKEYGFDEGIRPWEAEFRFWSPDIGFVWFIKNQLGDRGGRILLIDAVSGHVIQELSWRAPFEPSN